MWDPLSGDNKSDLSGPQGISARLAVLDPQSASVHNGAVNSPQTKGIGIRAQILIAVVGVVVLGFMLVYLVATPLLEGALRDEHRERVLGFASSVAAALEGTSSPDGLEDTLDRFSDGGCLGLADARGALSSRSQLRLRQCASDDELPGILASTSYRWLSSAGTGGRERLAALVPVSLEALDYGPGEASRVIVISDAGGIRARIGAVRVLLLLFFGMAILLTILIGYASLTRLIVAPIARLGRAIERLLGGERSAQVPVSGGREIQELGRAFNRLSHTLATEEKRIAHQMSELRLVNERLNQTQASLVRSEKLASVGQLAAGVAHEIGNPIGIALGYLEMTRRADTSPEEQREYIARAIDATQRVSEILRDLLEFSRPEYDGESECDAREAISHCVQLLTPQPRLRHVTLTASLPDDRVPVAISERRLVQVLVNLVLNAADATCERGAGTITLAIGRIALDLVAIRITDNGPGIPSDIEPRIFDPFFSTKDPGHGTGLGLPICYGIVTSAGGVLVLSQTGPKGTTFELRLRTGRV